MKKLVALISLMLVATLLLSSCAFGGVKIKDYENKVEQEEFVEKLNEALGLDGEEPFKESWTLKLKGTNTYESVREYKSGEKVKDTEKYETTVELKYNDDDKTGYTSNASKESYKSEEGKSTSKEEDKTFYTEGDGVIYTFDPITKMYRENESEVGVYDVMYEELMEEALAAFLGYTRANAEMFDKLEFYIDDNVYTIVVENEEEDEEEGTTTTINTVVQIVVDEDEITFVMESTREEKTENDNYTVTETQETKGTAVLELGKAKVKEPNKDKYTKWETEQAA